MYCRDKTADVIFFKNDNISSTNYLLFYLYLDTNDVSRKESSEIQGASVQKRRSSIVKTQKNTPVPQSSEHTAVDIDGNTEVDDKLITGPSPPPPLPISIFLQTADFLLNVNVLVVSASVCTSLYVTGVTSSIRLPTAMNQTTRRGLSSLETQKYDEIL